MLKKIPLYIEINEKMYGAYCSDHCPFFNVEDDECMLFDVDLKYNSLNEEYERCWQCEKSFGG